MGNFTRLAPQEPIGKPNDQDIRNAMAALLESQSMLGGLIDQLAPYFPPRDIVGADGRKYLALATETGITPVGPRLILVNLGDFAPDPVSLMAGIFDTVTTQLLAAVPSSSAISSIITGLLTAAASSGASPGSVVSDVEALFAGAFAVLDNIAGLVEAEVGDISTIASALATRFTGTNNPRPLNGDRIYTEAVGIVYELWKQKDGIPSGNSIFRVPFTVDGEIWIALTLIPAPDLGELIESVTNLALSLLRKLIAVTVDAIVQGAGAALVALFGTIEGILAELAALAGEVSGLAGDIADLNHQINDPDTGLAKKLSDLSAIVSNLDTDLAALQTIVNAIKALTDARANVSVIGADGLTKTINVFTSTDGANLKHEIKWIDSVDGSGHKTQTIFLDFDVPNTEKVDWRTIDYIAQNGTMMKTPVLTNIDGGFPKEDPNDDALELTSVTYCDPDTGETTTTLFLGETSE